MKVKLILRIILLFSCFFYSFSQWKEISQGLEGGEVQYICKGKNNDYFVAPYGDDLYFSNDGTKSWISCKDTIKYTNTSYIFSNNDTVIVTYGGGNFFNYSFDYGKKWNFVNTSLNSVLLSVFKDNKFYVATTQQFAVSLDTGKNWIQTGPNLAGSKFVKALYESNMFYLITEEGLYRSNDNGSNWYCSPFEAAKPHLNNFKTINDVLYFTYYDTLFYSNNQGENWLFKKTNIPSIYNFELINNYFYLNTNNYGNFLLLKDFSEIKPINDIFKNQVILYSKIIDSTAYFCTNTGLYASTDDGKTWEERNNGLPYKNIFFFSETEIKYI